MDENLLEIADWLSKPGNYCINSNDPFYPKFNGIEENIPLRLFYKGKKPNAKLPSIGIVGTRRPDGNALQAAFRIGLEYAANGINVITGLAEGCDQAAAIGALSAKEVIGDSAGVCYAIIGSGLEKNYPYMTNSLKERIISSGGAVISQFPPNFPPLKYNFPKRNIVIAAYSDIVVVVQAPYKSGSLITADFCLQMGKDLYVSSSGIGKLPHMEGTEILHEEGAPVLPHIKNGYFSEKCSPETPNSIRFCDCFYVLKQ